MIKFTIYDSGKKGIIIPNNFEFTPLLSEEFRVNSLFPLVTLNLPAYASSVNQLSAQGSQSSVYKLSDFGQIT